MAPPEIEQTLAGRTIAVPEARELDVLDKLLRRRGAEVYRCPLLAIVDAPDPAPVTAWIEAFIASPPDILVLMTGEGLKRLLGVVERHELDHEGFVRALGATTLISRGPKPARVLRRLGLAPTKLAARPTSAGVIETLETMSLTGARVALQLYGDNPNERLAGYIGSRGATLSTVAPYRYAAALSEQCIERLVGMLETGALDAIVFTSQAQVERLFAVADDRSIRDRLDRGLQRTCIAAIGPVVRAALAQFGCRTDIEPEERFFMKPLVAVLGRELGAARGPRPGPGDPDRPEPAVSLRRP